MDWGALTAFGTAATALAAFVTALIARRVGNDQVKLSITANGVNLAIQIRAHINSAEFRDARRKASSALLEDHYSTDVLYVLDELETIGLLVKRGALDAEIIWTVASALVTNYVAAARRHIDADRQRNPTLWSNVLYLNDQMIDVERREGGTDADVTQSYRAYLETEVREMAPASAPA